MSAAVESLFLTREPAWHGLGTILPESPTSEDAIVAAGLDWTVEKKPIFDASENEIKNYFANTRDKDGSVLGVVSGRYEIVQNKDAFAFTDSLVDEGLTYESAGSLRDGRTIFLLGHMPKTTILGDDVDPYICFVNSFDGYGAIQCCCCHTRVVCQNTLNIALREAKRKWSTRHTGDIQSKLDEAKITLGLIDRYSAALKDEAEKLASIKITDTAINHILDDMFHLPSDASDRQKRTLDNIKESYFARLRADDIVDFRGTAYAALMAATDYADHNEPVRKTKNFKSNRMLQVIQGHPFVDNFYERLAA